MYRRDFWLVVRVGREVLLIYIGAVDVICFAMGLVGRRELRCGIKFRSIFFF